MPKIELPVNPKVLKWARKTAGLTIIQVEQQLDLKKDSVLELESGITTHQVGKALLQNLARLYRRSFPVLLLPDPPTDDDIPTDYRTLPVRKRAIGPDTAQSLREARRLQDALSDLIRENPKILPPFKSFHAAMSDKPASVALKLRAIMDVDVRQQKRWLDPNSAFRSWRGRLQRLGILVVVQDFPREEARGFSLWHPDLVPMIVVSRNEAPAAQIFTLFHELAHILLRSDAMCLRQETTSLLGTVEAWCNKVAATTLVPDDELRSLLQARGQGTPREWLPDQLYDVASYFKVSRHVIAIRLEEIGVVAKGYYAHIKGLLDADDYRTPQHPPEQTREAEYRRNMPQLRLAEVGFATANAILTACKDSLLSTTEAADLLDLRPRKFAQLLNLASAQKQRYG